MSNVPTTAMNDVVAEALDRNLAELLDALGMTTADLSAPERETLTHVAGDEGDSVRRLAGVIRRSRR